MRGRSDVWQPFRAVLVATGTIACTSFVANLAGGAEQDSIPSLAPIQTATDSLAAVDSTAAAFADSTAPLETPLAFADSTAPLETQLAFLQRAAAQLPEADRLVLRELVEATREMAASGDAESARLLLDDAVEFLRQRSP